MGAGSAVMLDVRSARVAKPPREVQLPGCAVCGSAVLPARPKAVASAQAELHLCCVVRGRQTSRMPRHPGKLSIMENVSDIKKIIYIMLESLSLIKMEGRGRESGGGTETIERLIL